MGGRWELPPGRLGLIGSRDDLAGIEQTSWIEEPLDFTTNLQLCRKVLGKETGTGEAEPLFTTQGAIEPHDRRHEVGRVGAGASRVQSWVLQPSRRGSAKGRTCSWPCPA